MENPMHIARAFRHGNTVRVTLNRHLRAALKIQPRDLLMLDHVAPGQLLMTNLSEAERVRKSRKPK